MFFETRKLMESTNLGYLHDLTTKFQNNFKNSPHTTIILDYTFPNIRSSTIF